MPVPTKVAFIKFRHRRDAAVSLHLTNAILVDKLIQVIPWREGFHHIIIDLSRCFLYSDEMPTEAVALQSLFPGTTMGGSFGVQPPRLEQIMAEADLPPPPTIPSSVDSGKSLFV